MKRGNSKNQLPNPFINKISKIILRLESTFNQFIEHFDIECVIANSIISFLTILEIKFLCF